ncbi:MAG TPA: hypothetical protein VMW62_03480 [Chloroflexota bacterium]|nr:hypothetical protein [Chloroflexota bacterium]
MAERRHVVMEPDLSDPLEAEGVCNPAAVRGPDGQLYLFPRLVARGNYSRIGVAGCAVQMTASPPVSSVSASPWRAS